MCWFCVCPVVRQTRTSLAERHRSMAMAEDSDVEEDPAEFRGSVLSPYEWHLRQWNIYVFMEVSICACPAGRLVFELRYDVVPRAADNFRCLCTGERGNDHRGQPLNYAGLQFQTCVPDHAVIGGFMLNGGRLPSVYGDMFPDENFRLRHSRAGLLSMVSSGPHSNGAAFLITFVRARQLDGQQVVFGGLTEGWETLDEIEKNGSVTGRPLRNITIDRCGVITRT